MFLIGNISLTQVVFNQNMDNIDFQSLFTITSILWSLLSHSNSSRTKTYGEWAFAVAAPALWNAVPIDIRNSATVSQFKARLKTHLFKVAFLVLFVRVFLVCIIFHV